MKCKECTRVAPKLKTPILLCWPTTSEADVGDMAVEVQSSCQYSVKFCCRATDDSRGAVWHGSEYEAKVCNWIAPNDIHQWLLNVYRDQTVDVSAARQWVVRFSSGNSDVKDKPRSGRPCTAVTPRNEECLDQLIRKNQRIMTREMCMELNIGFNALEKIVGNVGTLQILRQVDPKMLPSPGKVMCTVFWDRKGVILLDFLEPGQTINCDYYIAMLTKLKAWISIVRPEKKTTFLLQHDNARPHTSLKTVDHIVNLDWTVLPHPPYSPYLAPSDFHLFGPMKDGLHGQHFPSNDAVVWAVKQWATSTGADFYERSMQALVHRRRKCIANGGDYVEK